MYASIQNFGSAALKLTRSNYFPYFCFNDIISPEKNQRLSNLHLRILETIYFLSFDVLMLILFIQLFVGGLITIQDFNHTNNRRVQADAFICNACLAALKMPLSFQLLSVNHSGKLNWSSNSDTFSLHCTLPQHAAFFSL